jgi:regulation of enolase protein 1 (concanavalin A-like superfamily)
MLRYLAVMLALVGGLAAADKGGDEKGETVAGWGEVVNPDADCRVMGDPGRLLITVPGTPHDFAAELGRWNAPRVMTRVKGDFIVQVRVSGALDPGNQSTAHNRRAYQGAGLVLVADDRNHVSLQKGALLNGDGVRRYANFEARKDGKVQGSRNGMELEIRPIWLRLERHGTRVHALVSDDGVRWKAYEPIDMDGLPDEVSVGVEAVSSSAHDFMSEFDHFAIFQRTAPATQPATAAAK